MKKSELIFGALQVPMDLIMLSSAFFFAYTLRAAAIHTPLLEPLSSYMRVVLYLAPFWLVIFILSGLYSLRGSDRFSLRPGKVFLAVTSSVMLSVILGYLTPNPYVSFPFPDPIFPSKYIPVFGLVFSLILVTAGRGLIYLFRHILFSYGIGVTRLLVIGATRDSEDILEKIKGRKKYKIVGLLDSSLKAGEKFDGTKVVGAIEDLDSFGGRDRIDEILLAETSLTGDELRRIIAAAENAHLSVKILPNTLSFYAAHSKMTELFGTPVIELERTPLSGWGVITKRGFDVVVSALMLAALSPLFLVIAALIKLTSRGPVFFIQKRLGLKRNEFKFYKFRTMVHDAEKLLPTILAENPDLKKHFERYYKLPNDPRVTKFGKFLRRTSLDELPQLFNVFLNDMSLVGPRPYLASELSEYKAARNQILTIKPGITGLWQITGRSDLSFDQRMKLEMYYVENWSLYLDMAILFETALKVARSKGAY